jgi:microcystin-dependent protein
VSRKFLTPISLPADPTQPLEAATKQYVDAKGDEVSVGPNDPISTTPGTEIWYDSDAEVVAAGQIGTSLPPGTVQMYAGDTVPNAAWMFCRGQAISRTTYAALFTAISTKYGTGDGSTTFNLPNFQGNMPVGYNTGTNTPANATGLWTAGPGERGGVKDLIVVAHSHTGVDHLHGVSINSGYVSADHSHAVNINSGGQGNSHYHNFGSPVPYMTANSGYYYYVSGAGGFPEQIRMDSFGNVDWATHDHGHNVAGNTGGISANHYHGVSGNTGAADRSLTTGTTGASGTNANIPPGLSINFMIKVM